MLEEIALIEKSSGGHTFKWLFRESRSAEVELLIERQLTEPLPGFERLSIEAGLEAMREARICQQQHIAKGVRT